MQLSIDDVYESKAISALLPERCFSQTTVEVKVRLGDLILLDVRHDCSSLVPTVQCNVSCSIVGNVVFRLFALDVISASPCSTPHRLAGVGRHIRAVLPKVPS